MDREQVWRTVHQERRLLADLLDTLTGQEWERPSLCAGWTVRDVAAHVISSAQISAGAQFLAMVRARGDFDRCMRDEARRASRRPVERIVADYRRLDGSHRHPLGTTHLDPLLDVLVHTQDIAVPLGRTHPVPVAAAMMAAGHVWARSFPFHARTRFDGLRLTATDTSWTVGQGHEVSGPIAALLLVLTGRAAGLAGLTGPGTDELGTRLEPPVRVR